MKKKFCTSFAEFFASNEASDLAVCKITYVAIYYRTPSVIPSGCEETKLHRTSNTGHRCRSGSRVYAKGNERFVRYIVSE